VTRVLLTGLMATGKSSVGQAVAAATGWPCLDNDVLLERSTGATAAELLAEHGVEHLRAAESDVLTLLVSMPGPFVAGVAAGTVLSERDRERMRAAGHVVWLRAPVDLLVRRVRRQDTRPWLGDDPAPALRAMAEEREHLYAETAHQVIDTDRVTPAQAAREVLAALRPS
jgi:shikimate kinase